MSAGGTAGGQGTPAAPPAALPSHAIPLPPAAAASNPLLAAAREQERIYMELLSRPPYNTDPVLAQQVGISSDISEHLLSLSQSSEH